MRPSDLPRYWHTLKYLKPTQIVGRLWFRLARPRPELVPAPLRRQVLGEWGMPACREPSLIGPLSFRFLNVAGDLEDVGWEGSQREKLWRYNQHYFDDLNARDADGRAAWHVALLKDWVVANPPRVGTGWEPYPTSLRIVNWVKWALAGHELPEAARQSLAVQARWLRRRLEWHLLGNHLFANAKALVFAGCFFEGDEASAWLDQGLAILAEQIPEQILADGGQFERSPMYHALAVEDVLDLMNLLRAYPGAVPTGRCAWADALPELAGRMLEWLRVMCHPDGEIAFFNDAAIGIAPSPDELANYAARLGMDIHPVVGVQPPVRDGVGGATGIDRPGGGWPPTYEAGLVVGAQPPARNGVGGPSGAARPEGWPPTDEAGLTVGAQPPARDGAGGPSEVDRPGGWPPTVRHLVESGYIRLEAPSAVALLDVAPIGPDYLPGHAHADTLSFELSLFGQRVIVNGGTSRYGLGPERLQERSTAAHSTVTVAGENSSEVWGGFRVARRARPFDLRVDESTGRVAVTCSHDGYRRLSGRPIHRRDWVMSPTGLQVRDTVSGPLPAVARYLLHPDVRVIAAGDSRWLLTLPNGNTVSIEVVTGEFSLESSYYGPEFGRVFPTHCLAVKLTNGVAAIKVLWG